MNASVTLENFRTQFETYKNEVKEIALSDIDFLWFNDYWDGMLEGILAYKNKKYRFEIITDYVQNIRPRIFAIVELTLEQIEEEAFWHDLFTKHVGDHNTAPFNSEGTVKPQADHHLFYDKYKTRLTPNYSSNIVIGWYKE